MWVSQIIIEEIFEENYVIEEPATTLRCIRLLSNIGNKKGLLLNIKDDVNESINLIETDNAEINGAIQDIKDFYGRCGFTEFRD